MKWGPVLMVLRSSEFWLAVGQAVIEVAQAPVPVEYKAMSWGYVGVRVASKLLKFIFPNPANPQGGWMKNDTP